MIDAWRCRPESLSTTALGLHTRACCEAEKGGCGGGVSKGDGTDAATLTLLVPEHENFLRRYDVCIVRKERRASLRRYLRGQLSDLERKSIEPMAVSSGSHTA